MGVALAAVPLGLWGIVRTSGKQRRGRGLAVAALCISAVWVVVGVALFWSGLANTTAPSSAANQQIASADASLNALVDSAPSSTTSKTPVQGSGRSATANSPLQKPKRVFWRELKPSMCVRDPASASSWVTTVDCRSDHQTEVIRQAVLKAPREWPGAAAIDDAADVSCQGYFDGYVGIPFDDSRLDVQWYTADKAAWQEGNHTLICMVVDRNRSISPTRFTERASEGPVPSPGPTQPAFLRGVCPGLPGNTISPPSELGGLIVNT
jgi:hypothetical protein